MKTKSILPGTSATPESVVVGAAEAVEIPRQGKAGVDFDLQDRVGVCARGVAGPDGEFMGAGAADRRSAGKYSSR